MGAPQGPSPLIPFLVHLRWEVSRGDVLGLGERGDRR